MQARHLHPVLQDDGEPVAAPEAEPGQPIRDAANLGIPFGVGKPPLAVDNRHRVGAALDARKEAAAEIKHRLA
jgi:hypothetical protein